MNRSPAGRCWVLAALLILVGCSATVDGSAEADPSAIRLDTGGYPTAPRAVPERTNINDSRVQSSYDLSAYLVAPAEIDKNFTWVAPASTPVLPSLAGLGTFFGIPFAAPLSQNESFVGGAVSARQTTKIERESPDTARMFTALIRYRTAENAGAAARAVRTGFGADQPSRIPAHPDAFPGAAITPRGLTRVWWMPVGDQLLMVGFGNVGESSADALAATWFDRQIAALRTLTTTAEQMLRPPPDRDGIMSLTLPNVVRTSDGTQPSLGYLTPRAWLHAAADDWLETKVRLEQAGVDLIGAAGSVVQRTRSGAAARNLFDDYSRDAGASGAATTRESAARGVPGVVCESYLTRANGDPRKAYSCAFVAGRYYVSTDAVSTLVQAHQQATASYLMVKDAK